MAPPPEPRDPSDRLGPDPPGLPPTGRPLQGNKYGRYVAILGVIFLIGVTVNTILTKANGATGILPGAKVPPFAAPLVLSKEEEGKVDTAVKANEGIRGKVPACKLRGEGILNICELYERGPVVLALFFEEGSCPDVLSEMQKLAPSFPGVSFAAVAIKSKRPPIRELMHKKGLTLPVGFDLEGNLAPFYKIASCPQVSFIYPGGVVQSKALLGQPTPARLRARVEALVAASKKRASGGRSSEGRASAGHPSEGQASEGQASEGQASEGHTSKGQASEGHTSEGQASEGK
ncbi:MAG TPA: hypothetical protein VGF95_13875 [Solirubrobacteraceae bacterium]